MKNVLIINGHQKYEGIAEGKLTSIYLESANKFLHEKGFAVKNSIVESNYDVQEELEKFKWADYILFQYPIYWMGVPWLTKKYLDEVFSGGGQSVTYESDGRSREDASKRYGSGGLMKNKKYMLSLTYNCPTSEFSDAEGFFDGLSLDEANIATHKIFQFCGAKPLQTYSVHDIFKGDLNMNSEIKVFEEVLHNNFSVQE